MVRGFNIRIEHVKNRMKKSRSGENSWQIFTVAIVGHQPSINQFMAWLIGSKKAQLELAKAGIAKVAAEEWGKGEGVLSWMLAPEWYGK